MGQQSRASNERSENETLSVGQSDAPRQQMRIGHLSQFDPVPNSGILIQGDIETAAIRSKGNGVVIGSFWVLKRSSGI